MTMLTMERGKEEFESFIGKYKAELSDETGVMKTTPLQLACIKGRLDIVQFLLDDRADVNKTGTEENRPPVHLACYFGQYEILKRLLGTDEVNIWFVNKKSLLHSVLEGLIDFKGSTDGYRKCFDYLLEQNLSDVPINHPDTHGNTALHYAARFEDVHYAKALFQHGAYIGQRNEFGFSPLDYISPYALEEILDDCVECTKRKEDGNYELMFNFSFMNPTESRDTAAQTWNDETSTEVQENLPEMSLLNFISRSNKLGHLLKHPVLLVFLHLNWTRICWMFCINMIAYIAFVIYLTENILSQTCSDGNYNGNWSEDWFILPVLWMILVLINIVEFCLLQKKWLYFFNLENILKVIIILLTILILVGYCCKVLASVTLLLAWMEVMLLLGCFYSLAVYIEMMKRVTLNYMKFLISNTPLILAFSFSFYELHHQENPSERNGGTSYVNNTSGISFFQDDNVDFYSNLLLSLLKTVFMMIGEFVASDMSLDNGSYLVFLFFVFMMVIVMMNLLNGLAVSETQAIGNDAELVACRYRMKLVDRYLSLVSGNSCIKRCMSKLICESQSLRQGKLQKPISLFQDSFQDVLNKVLSFIGLYMERNDSEKEGRSCCKICKFRIRLAINREVLIAAKNIVDKKAKAFPCIRTVRL